MPFFADLSPYCYHGATHPKLFNIGWLSKDQPFNRGSVPPVLVSVLRFLDESPQNLCRGFHVCEFCEPPLDILRQDKEYFWIWASARQGNGEIHLPGLDGVTYAAPRLILHYILEHQYRPPQEFIEAAIRFHELQPRTRNA
jgi:hypothetical protein